MEGYKIAKKKLKESYQEYGIGDYGNHPITPYSTELKEGDFFAGTDWQTEHFVVGVITNIEYDIDVTAYDDEIDEHIVGIDAIVCMDDYTGEEFDDPEPYYIDERGLSGKDFGIILNPEKSLDAKVYQALKNAYTKAR